MNTPKCPTGYSLAAHENKDCNCVSQGHRNPVAVAMQKRYQNTTTTMKDRRMKRANDAKKSWKREDW